VSVWGVLRDAGRLYRLLFWRSVLIAAAIFLLFDLPTSALDVLPDDVVTVAVASVVLTLLTAYGDLLLEGILAFDILDLHEGRPEPTLRDLLRKTRPFLLPLAVGALVYASCLTVGLLLLVVPGLFVLTRWSVLVPVIVIERCSVRKAFGRSNRLVKGNSWRVLIVVAIMFAVDSLAEIFFDNVLFWMPEFYAHWVGGLLASALAAPFAAHTLAAVYYRLIDPDRPVVDFRALRSS
jgi:hypothetical protein